MLSHATNGNIPVDDTDMDYISFGRGAKRLILIPGIGDGLRTVKGAALPLAFAYRQLAADFTVYAFSRRNRLPDGYSTKEMARDLDVAMEALAIESACVLGVSQGGMIAQYLAIDHPARVEKLILAVTLARPNETEKSVIGNWIRMARAGDYKGIMMDTAEKSYSAARVKEMRWMYSLLASFTKPKSFHRFLVMADACLSHNAYGELERIACPTLVIAGAEDRIVTGEASEELAARIADSQLILYDGLGHAAYDEAKDFIPRVAAFCGP